MSKTPPPKSLLKYKYEDPDKLREIREKALETRRIKRDKQKTFKEILNAELDIVVGFRDKQTGQLKKDSKGNLIQITKKELLALSTIENMIENPNIKDIKELGTIIGEIEEKKENNVNLVFDSIRKELEEYQEDNKKENI